MKWMCPRFRAIYPYRWVNPCKGASVGQHNTKSQTSDDNSSQNMTFQVTVTMVPTLLWKKSFTWLCWEVLGPRICLHLDQISRLSCTLRSEFRDYGRSVPNSGHFDRNLITIGTRIIFTKTGISRKLFCLLVFMDLLINLYEQFFSFIEFRQR